MLTQRRLLLLRERPISRMKNGYLFQANRFPRQRQPGSLLPLRRFTHCAPCATPATSNEPATPPVLHITSQVLYSASCLLMFSTISRLLHLYVSLHSLQFLLLGLVWRGRAHRHAAAASLLVSLEAMSVFPWMVYLAFFQYYTRFQYVEHYIVCRYVHEGRAWRSEDLLFVVLVFESELSSFCLTLHRISVYNSYCIYFDEITPEDFTNVVVNYEKYCSLRGFWWNKRNVDQTDVTSLNTFESDVK
ncbi:hypothetical protein BDM02DRAFT_2528744 [Thelephora ganbajun]|uniref:Uncharacterized protein n=1 Tax=Thelephora ganbajun TaxID=370292 RepID=A0ACB6ZDL8_THEGA|nr:hypothetical protein BDM02DRAFT_2528744 [Thelephora ganbajun]